MAKKTETAAGSLTPAELANHPVTKRCENIQTEVDALKAEIAGKQADLDAKYDDLAVAREERARLAKPQTFADSETHRQASLRKSHEARLRAVSG